MSPTDPHCGQIPPTADILEAIEAAAVDIARRSGGELLRYFAEPLDVRFKSKRDKDPVTDADEAVERFVRAEVACRFPGHGVLGEEGADADAGSAYLWVVDPLDGTANFANGLPIFAVSIGILYEGEPIVAALYTTFGPDARPCVMHARVGSGLSIDGTQVAAPAARPFWPRPAFWRAGGISPWISFSAFGGYAARRDALARQHRRGIGAPPPQAGCNTRCSLRRSIWDVAAGVLLVQEAGGSVYTDRNGRWQQLRRFEAPPGRPLREWKQAVVAGDPAALGKIVPRARVRHTPVDILERLAGPVWTARTYNFVRRHERAFKAIRAA